MIIRSFITINIIMACFLCGKAQKTPVLSDPIREIGPVSKTRVNDNTAFPLLLVNADYDILKKNMPFFSKVKIIPKGQLVKINLKKEVTAVCNDEVSQSIRDHFGKFLSSDFSFNVTYAQSGRNYMAYLSICPYRINSENKIEELVSFETEWETYESSSTLEKKALSPAFKNNSVLASGNWYKIGITKNGIYKIDKTFLQNMGIDVSSIDPRNIRIYGNGGHMLPGLNSAYRYDDLEENAIQLIGENDGVFNTDDHILFYGQATDQWNPDLSHALSCLNYYHQLSYYSDTSFYYITIDPGPGKRIGSSPVISSATNSTSTFDYYDFHEENLTNFIKSGSEFYGEYFDFTTSFNFNYPIPDLVVGDTVSALVTVAARGSSASTYALTFSGSTSSFTSGAVDINDYLGSYAAITSQCGKTLCNNPSLLNFSVSKQTPGTVGWLDQLIFNCRRYLNFSGAQFNFRDARTIGSGNITAFNITINSPQGTNIWNVSDITNVKDQPFITNGNQLQFNAYNDSLQEFIIFNGSDHLKPNFVAKIENQDLHSIAQADYVIICPPSFFSQAQRLAQLHQQQEGLTSAVVTCDQVYNEFSSGKQDPVAIRDFTRMLYQRNFAAGREVKYVLLFGDGSYKVKDRYAQNNTSLLPVYETGAPLNNSWDPTASTVTDDFYGWLDASEGDSWLTAKVDVGIGRLPVKNISEAKAAVDKIENYYRKDPSFNIYETGSSCTLSGGSPLGDWRNWITFVGDDEDAAVHMSQADMLAGIVKSTHPEYNIDKIYADAFIQYSTPGEDRYYDVSSGIDHRIEKGALVLNYTGHGGEVGLGHERYLEISQIQSYNNKNNLPLFITATCEFSRFDDPDRTSAGELCFLNPNGAAIALLTTVRVAYSTTNYDLNSMAFNYLFDTLPGGNRPALGDVMRLTKSNLNIVFQYLNFHLLGDPALRLAYPDQHIFTTHINNKVVSAVYDTIKALSKVTIKGFVGDKNGNKLTNFNGVLFPTIFDKAQTITCLANDPGSLIGSPPAPFKFSLQKNIIYKGKAQVTNGDFTFTFIVPKDISYYFDPGKISYYAHNGVTDASGSFSGFLIGGSANNIVADNSGPSVNLFMNDSKFVSGGTTNEHPDLYAETIDSSGINTSGIGVGHDIVAILDESSSKPVILNDYYEADLNSYQSGKIRYPFSQLAEGHHRLSLKVWDVQNNSSVAYTDFIVAPTAQLALSHVLNYPNPFTTRTKFYFENNQCCLSLKVNIQIFTVSGKMVKTITHSVNSEGFRSDGIEWDGKDDYGDKLARGVYLYKLTVYTPQQQKLEKTEKLVILN